VVLLLVLLFVQACGHGRPTVAAAECGPERQGCFDGASEDGVRIKGGSFNARITALIAKGQFAEARVLIAEGIKAGTLSQQAATRLLERIDKLGMKLGEVPASLQRVANFPSQLRDYTLFQIESMLKRQDYSLASHAQLRMAAKLIEQEPRLMAD
jgi:hypothetical protein